VGPLDLDADKQAFVDAVMEPLGEDSARRGILEDCLGMAESFPRVSQGDSMDAATERMRKSARGFGASRGVRRSVWMVAVLGGAWFAVVGLPALRSWDRILVANRLSNSVSSMCCEHGDIPIFPRIFHDPPEYEEGPSFRRVLERMEPDQRLILTGDREHGDMARWMAVWERYPDDPAHFYAYALRHLNACKCWPDRLVETGEKLDPENGWFRLMAGTDLLRTAVVDWTPPLVGPPRPRSLPDKPKVQRVIVKQAAFDRAFELLDQALAMPRWDDYDTTLNRIRFAVTPVPEDFSRYTAYRYLSSLQPEDLSDAWGGFRVYTDAFSLAVGKAAKDGDRQRMEELGGRLHQISERLAGMETRYFPRLILRNFGMTGSRALAKGWKDLGDSARALPYELAANTLDPKRSKPPTPPPDAMDEGRSSGFSSKTHFASRPAHASAVTEPEVRGGRLAEYALYERFMTHAAATVLGLIVVFLVIAWRRDRKRLGLLPTRLMGLLGIRDHALILLLGLGLPLGLYVISTRAGYLGAREFALGGNSFVLWMLQILALVIGIVLVSLLAARWRLSRRATMLGIGGRWMEPEVWVAVLALGMIPVAAALPKLLAVGGKVLEMLAWISAGFMAGLPLIWLLYLAAYQFAGNPERRLHRALLTRGAAWPVALAIVIAALAVYGLHQEEKYWVARMDYDALDEKTNMLSSRGEWEEAEWVKAEVKRVLEGLR
jgi:hypothetical protein